MKKIYLILSLTFVCGKSFCVAPEKLPFLSGLETISKKNGYILYIVNSQKKTSENNKLLQSRLFELSATVMNLYDMFVEKFNKTKSPRHQHIASMLLQVAFDVPRVRDAITSATGDYKTVLPVISELINKQYKLVNTLASLAQTKADVEKVRATLPKMSKAGVRKI